MANIYERKFFTGNLEAVNPVGIQTQAAVTEQSANESFKTGQNLMNMGAEIYRMDIENQAREQLRTAYEQNASNPDGFEKQAQQIRKGLFKNSFALPSIRAEAETSVVSLYDDYKQKVAANFTQKQNDDYKFTVLKTIDQRQRDIANNMAAAIMPDGSFNKKAIDSMAMTFTELEGAARAVDSSGQYLFSAEQQLNIRQNALKDAANSALFESVRVSNNPAALAKRFASGDLGFEIDVDGEVTKIALRDYVDQSTANLVMNEADRRQREYEAQQNRQLDVAKAELNFRAEQAATLEDFNILNQDVEKMRGQLGEKGYYNLKTKLLKMSEKQLEDVNFSTAGRDFAIGNAQLNPENSDDLKALDTYYSKELQPTLAQLPMPQRNEYLATVVDNTKVVPKTLMGQVESAAYSTDINKLDDAADLITRIEQRNPLLLQRFNQRDLAIVNSVKSMREAGYAPEAINERLKILRQPVTKAQAEERTAAAKDLVPTVDDVLNDVYDSFITLQPDITDSQRAEMQRVIDTAYKSHYVLTADEAVSKKHAQTIVKQQFGPTKVNGRKEVMRYAPEQYYSINGLSESENSDWIREDMMSFVKQQVKDSLQPYDEIKDRVMLVPDPIMTPKTSQKGQPVYNVMIIGEDGLPRSLLGKGQYWFPDRNKKLQELKGL